MKFWLDDQVPLGACHHQKVVVIDDRLAFCGGGDISIDRWDTPGHLDDDQRRIMPDQECHDPRHEVMMMVDGDAAAALAEHFRARWRDGTKHEPIEPAPDAGGDPWPDHVPPHLIHTRVAIARTHPAWRRRPCIQEIRDLTLACIAGAEHTIYLENQYFTSPVVTEALARRLGEPDGPDVVLIATGVSPSWFDQLTMDRTRGAMIWRLRAADVFGRFRALYPVTSAGSKIIVHSKTSVFDDRIVRVGSANLNNRSFGFDTEIELAVECDDEEERRNLAAFRDRLVGHFLGYTGEAVAKARADHGGLARAIDALNREGRLADIDPVAAAPSRNSSPPITSATRQTWPTPGGSGVAASGCTSRPARSPGARARGLLGQVEIHHERQVVRGDTRQRVEGGGDLVHLDPRTHEEVVDAKDRQGRGKGRRGLLALRQPPGGFQSRCEGAVDDRAGRGVEVAKQDCRPGAVDVTEPVRTGQVGGLHLLLARDEAQVGVDDLDRAALDLHLDPKCAARFESGHTRVAGQGAHLDEPFGEAGEDGVAVALLLGLQRGVEMVGHLETVGDLAGLVGVVRAPAPTSSSCSATMSGFSAASTAAIRGTSRRRSFPTQRWTL